MKFAILTVLVIASSLSLADPSETYDWNQWALKNSGQAQYKETGEIYNEKIVGEAGMDIGMPTNEVMNELEKIDREIVVAVIDRGIDMNHPKFKGRLFKGKDFLDNSPMKDDNGHGTHVAGIIAANHDDGGIRGVTPSNVKILPLKVLSDQINGFIYTRGSGNKKQHILITDIIADAINYATDAGVDVINMSLGWPKTINTPRVEKALDDAANKGIVLVAASGNNNKNVPLWPCSHKAVICVGSMNNQGEISEFSNHGAKVDLVTSGEWIISTIPNNIESRSLRIQGQEVKNGSSQAAPFVSAAAALLKLKYPTITADEIKATLFNTAEKITVMEDGLTSKFVKYGRLNIQAALKLGPSSLFTANIKDLHSVKVKNNGDYEFSIPLEHLGNIQGPSELKILGLENHSISRAGGKVIVNGRLTDLSQDSEMNITLIAKNNKRETKFPLTLTLSRVLDPNKSPSLKITDYPANKLLKINGAQKRHAMGIVSEEDIIDHDFISYTTETDKKNNEIKVHVFSANSSDSTVETQSFTLGNQSQFLAVFKKDVNLDGKPDFMFYALDKDRRNLTFTLFDQNGELLFGSDSTWTMPITGFSGLPLIEKERSDFSWIKLDTFLGEIAVPYFKRAWTLPNEDNGQDLLDFETGRRDHFFYLKPQKMNNEVVVTPRAFDSVTMVEEMRSQLGIDAAEEFTIESIIPQTLAEKLAGEVRHMVSVGNDFYRKYFQLTAKKVGSFSIVEHINQDPFQIQNMFVESVNLDTNKTRKNSFQLALLDRSKARVGEFNEEKIGETWNLETSGWSNPFFQIIGAFQSEEKKTLFFESRYHVYVYEKASHNGEMTVAKLPVNRDSSFPGVEFSETLKPATILDGNKKSAGIAVDSTLIYGDRLYTMVKTNEEFKRPISLSIEVPENCIPLKSRYLEKSLEVSSYVLLCEEYDNSASLRFVPLVK